MKSCSFVTNGGDYAPSALALDPPLTECNRRNAASIVCRFQSFIVNIGSYVYYSSLYYSLTYAQVVNFVISQINLFFFEKI